MPDTTVPPGYRVLQREDIAPLIAHWPAVAQRLGGSPAQWQVRDVADGNLNAVYLVEGPRDGVCVKQSLPYVRVAKDDWPLSVERAYFESAYMQRTEPFVPGLVPQFLHFDPVLHVIVMERLQPHGILRKALIAGTEHPQMAQAVADFAAASLFHTSDIHTPFERKFEDVALFSRNHDLQRITVDLVFIDPFQEHPRNRYASPQLDAVARSLRDDAALKAAVARFRNHYLAKPQALLHGDLHSGSVMVTAEDTRVIDGEFAWVGPIGFDTGMFIANLLLAWYAKPGHSADAAHTGRYRAWIVDQVHAFWLRFHAQFLAHWNTLPSTGDGYPQSHFAAGSENLRAVQATFLENVWQDTLGFAAIEIIRRTIGFSQIADFTQIADVDLRSRQQAAAIALARDLLLHPAQYPSVHALTQALARFETQHTLQARTVLLDIEGTVGAKTFLTQVLYPYARAHLRSYIAAHAQDPVVVQALQDTVALSGDAHSDPVDTLLAWIDQDRKAPPLKKLQGLVWQSGFEQGAFEGHLYPDAVAAIQAWQRAGLTLAIYSSGSVHAQKLYFGHSAAGNLLPALANHFDTEVGAKTEAASYQRIAQQLGQSPELVLFLSDSVAELEAAHAAGLQVRHVVREDTRADPRFASVYDFSELTIQALP